MPFFDTNDGARLAYEDYGTGRPIVFVASWALNADMWEYQIPFFVEQGYRCIALDRRGHGRSDRPSTGYDMDTTADDLAALIEHLDLHDAILVGHSMGGAEVAHYLARHGESRVSRAAFVSAALPFLLRTEDNPGGAPEAALDAFTAAFRSDRPQWFARQAQVWFATHLGNDVSPATIDWMIGQCLSASPWASLHLFQSMFRTDFRPGLREITVPTLIIHGAADSSANIDVTARRTAQLIPDNVYKEYPTASHGLFITHKNELNADLLEFFKA
ncbi:alpha/beta hydrolase [Kitasatospora aureofaciens]|uniref:alpha/beta fold hydrolase n=1 Tax=Kitasatospora aureofaciens TaxID=1894 RepID=UPI001C4532C7|nr:alpha/beta hydrolase [Kitasatospora aureofaciens]MBV6698562.1 alpha/beta hydrolase [Kitasatospora aureofaciens]